MPPAAADFCARGHADWPLVLIARGSPLHYLCHTRFVGACTSATHTALCADTFHEKNFTLPAASHSAAIALFLKQDRDLSSEELHDYLVKAAAVYRAVDVIRLVAAHRPLVPHYHLLLAAKQIEPPTAPHEHLACIVGGIGTPPLCDMKAPTPCNDAIAVHAHHRWMRKQSTHPDLVPHVTDAANDVLAILPREIRDNVFRYLFCE